MRYIASCSFGKDSLAMVLLLIEKQYPLDEVIFFDTEMEFQAIYRNKEKLKKILDKNNIKFTELKDDVSFEYRAFDKPIKTRNGEEKIGYKWCGGITRWATQGKTAAINRYYKQTYGRETIIEYVGVCINEAKRIEKSRIVRKKFVNRVKIYPLTEWNMTEDECLDYCQSRGWDWIEDGVELYDVLMRVSCWCCANKNQKEIKRMIKYLPNYWQKIKDYEARCGAPYKGKGCSYYENKLKI